MKNFDVFNLDYRSLKALIVIIEQGSLAAAAHELDVTQSTLSHLIERLRKQLDDPLFYRSGRRNKPTSYLLSIVPQIINLMSLMEALPKPALFDPKDYSGDLVIAANVTEMLVELRHATKLIQDQTKAKSIRLRELGSRDQLLPLLKSGEADIAVSIASRTKDPELLYNTLGQDKQVIYFDASQRAAVKSAEEYGQAEHVVLDFGGNAKSNIDIQIEAIGLERKVVLGVPNVACLKMFVEGSSRICTMQSRLGASTLSGLQQCEVPFKTHSVEFEIVWHKRNENQPLVSWLRKVLTVAFNETQALPLSSH